MLQDPLTYSPEQRAELNRRIERSIAEGAEADRCWPLLAPHNMGGANGVGWAMTDRGTICVHLLDAYALLEKVRMDVFLTGTRDAGRSE